MNQSGKVEVLLFDLGGVLIELSGTPVPLAWSGLDEIETWRRWSSSHAVREFESGRSTSDDFGRGIVSEFGLTVSPEEFIEAFTHWPKGLFPGATDLLCQLRKTVHISCLSNTNHLHWERFGRETELHGLMHSTFASHHIGIMKPAAGIYEHTIEALNCRPEQILFFDDNQVNVSAAQAAGMRAMLTRGIGDIEQNLARAGVSYA